MGPEAGGDGLTDPWIPDWFPPGKVPLCKPHILKMIEMAGADAIVPFMFAMIERLLEDRRLWESVGVHQLRDGLNEEKMKAALGTAAPWCCYLGEQRFKDFLADAKTNGAWLTDKAMDAVKASPEMKRDIRERRFVHKWHTTWEP